MLTLVDQRQAHVILAMLGVRDEPEELAEFQECQEATILDVDELPQLGLRLLERCEEVF